MVSYFTPTLIPTSEENAGSRANSSFSESYFDILEASIEQLRGTPSSRPFHLFGGPPPGQEELLGPSPFESVRRLQVPEEELRKLPGCGINHFDWNDDESVRAEISPIDPNFFGSELKTYRRTKFRPTQRRLLTGRCFKNPQPPTTSAAAVLLGTPQSEMARQERATARPIQGSRRHPLITGQFSPLSSSSSSSSSSSPSPPYVEFQPIHQSTLMHTPPRQRYTARDEPARPHPALVPSYAILTPDYYPSPPPNYDDLEVETRDILPVRSNLFSSNIATGSLQGSMNGGFGMTYCPSPVFSSSSSSSYSASTFPTSTNSSGNIATFGSTPASQEEETSEGSYDTDASEYSTD